MISIDYREEQRKNNVVIKKIQEYRDVLTKQQYKTLVGQVKAGSRDAAIKGLSKLLLRLEREKILNV